MIKVNSTFYVYFITKALEIFLSALCGCLCAGIIDTSRCLRATEQKYHFLYDPHTPRRGTSTTSTSSFKYYQLLL